MSKTLWARILLAMAGVLPAPAALAGDSLLCVEQKKTGFALGSWSHEWEVAKFENYKRLVLRAPTDAEREAQPARVWMVAPEGKDFAVAECLSDFGDNGLLDCTGDLHVTINKSNGRFQSYYLPGYVAGRAGQSITEGELTPYLSIGLCTARP